MAQIPAIKCGYCKKAVADLYCDDCHQVLCVKCRQDVHDKVPGFKGHKVANIQKEGNRVFKPHPVCETHKKQFLCYCRKCECLTCAECMTSNHNEHKTEKIKSVADTCRQTVNQIIEKIKTKVEIAKKKIETIDNKFSVQIKSDCESYVATVTKTTGELHEITDRYKRIHLTTASDFEYIEKQDLEKKRTFFKRRHNETNDRLLKFENLLQETHDSTFLTEWKALQTDVQMNDEETDDLLAVPRRIESFNQTKLTKSVIDEIDEKFQMRLSREVEEKEKKVNELLEENEKLKTELKGRQQQEFSKLQENGKAVTKFEEEKTKLTDELKLKQDEIRTLSNEVHTNADKTNKLTINFEDRIRELERKLKESEKKNTSKLQTDKGLQYALTGCNTTNESDNQLTESDLNKNGADRFSKLSTETDTLKTLKLNQLQFCVLQNLDFILNKENPTCNAKMNKNAITFIDTQREVEKQMQIFFDYCIDTECLKNVQGKPTQIPERMLELAQRENIREYINKKLEIEAILCYWYSDRDEGYIKLFTLKGKGSKAVAVVQRCLDWEKITRSPAFDEVLKEKSMDTFINDHKANMIFDIHEKDLVVIGLKSGVRNFVELINRISEAHTKYEQTLILNRQKEITVLSSNILQHLRKFHSKEIEKFERKWNVFFKEENEAVLLQGVASDVQRASESLKDSSFIEQKWSCHVDKPVDVIKDLSSKSIPKLENQFCSSVFTDVNTSCISHQQLAQWVSQTKDQHIVFVHGSVTAMAADVIVYPVTKGEGQHRLGKIGKAIVTDGGCVMQGVVKEISRLEEIVITSSTGNLPCLMVAYFPVPFFKPEVQIEKEMVTRIQDILTEVAKTQLQSVVITTDIGNDIPESTFLRWFLLAYKACQYKLQCLNQIFLCTESEKISPLMDVLNDGLSNFLTLFDFTTMFEQRSPGISVTRKPADISIVIVNGKLVDQKVDILVNSSNRNLELEKGAVSASILEAGGERIYAECKQFYPNGISYGQVITTSPGNLRCKAICHGCLPHWKPIADISCQILSKLMFGCLLHADSYQSESIAFPVFGTGNLMYPWGEDAKTMIRAVFKYGRLFPDTTMKKVKIVLHGKDDNLKEAFEQEKMKMEEIQMRPEDPLKHSPLTLECRCNNVRVKLAPLSSLQFHHCQAIVIIFTYQQALDLQRDDPSSRLTRDRLTIKRSKTHKYWVISVIVDHRYQTFTQAIQRSLQLSEEKRLSTLAISVMTEPGDPRLKEQATLIRNCVDCTRDIRYLQILKIMMTNRDDFDEILTETIRRQEQERQSFYYKVPDWCNISKAQWKCVKNSETLNSPRLYLTIVGEDEKNINTMLQKLIKEISILKVKI